MPKISDYFTAKGKSIILSGADICQEGFEHVIPILS